MNVGLLTLSSWGFEGREKLTKFNARYCCYSHGQNVAYNAVMVLAGVWEWTQN